MAKTGVLLVNTGTPEEPTPQAVKKYLGRFLMDKRIAPMFRPFWWLLLHAHILPRRSVRSAEKYKLIWTPEGSPLKVAHEKLVSGLNAYYGSKQLDVVVRYAMSYSEPSVADALHELAREGAQDVVVLPLYPQSAFSTTGSVSDGVKRAVAKVSWRGDVTVVDGYHDDLCYIRAIAASITHAGFRADSDDRLIFSYHSIPLTDIEQGDTYELQTGATSLAVANELGLDRRRWTVGYQCRFDKGRSWLAPFTRSTLEGWAQSDSDARVFMVCPNFAVDCLETLYDVEYEIKPEYLENRRAWRESGERRFEQNRAESASSAHASHAAGSFAGSQRGIDMSRDGESVTDDADAFIYVPCLNKSKAHVRVLTHVLAPYVGDDLEES